MNCRDADMTEAEAAPPPPHVAVSSADPNDVRNLLTMARQLVHQGKPSQALQAVYYLEACNGFAGIHLGAAVTELQSPRASPMRYQLFLVPNYLSLVPSNLTLILKVVMAMKMQGGEQAVSEALKRAREMYINKVQATAAADELASLFAECAIAEAMPLQQPNNNNNNNNNMEDDRLAEPDPQGTSILAETGRKQIVLDAFSDGSSFVCLKCGGLVSNNRKEEHFTFWCCNG
ncbi:ubiquitin C-terminal hydrolases superfamily protein [Striga asiatica]|uniref:Ubiquitin C-terminal hydrolases superfamily protein n=1 Tax=Striga asiatica TaxID=4170 RepID=A0A5A7PNY1_STRAF|nr:ubiquitin C-terminal hydrolases superfamily protein [Striga asiatica]